MHIQIFVFFSVDDHSSSHEWWEKGSDNRGVEFGDGDACGEGNLLNHFCLHGSPKVLHVYFTGAQEFWPGKLQDKVVKIKMAKKKTK